MLWPELVRKGEMHNLRLTGAVKAVYYCFSILKKHEVGLSTHAAYRH